MAALDGVRIKLDRAHTHITELDQRLSPLLNVDRDNIVRNSDTDSTKVTFHVVKVPTIAPELSAIIGDIMFNLRSALDHLAWQLVRLDGHAPGENTQFPIFYSRTDKKGNVRAVDINPGLQRVDILDAVTSVQPYHTNPVTHDYLWAINSLCNTDKHRLLLVMVSALDLDNIWWVGDPVPFKVSLKPLNDGDPVAWFDFGDMPAPADFKPNLSLTIKLDEGPPGNIIRSFPVTNFLKACGEFIATILNQKFIDFFAEEWIAFGLPGTRLLPTDLARGWHDHKFPRTPGTTDPPRQ